MGCSYLWECHRILSSICTCEYFEAFISFLGGLGRPSNHKLSFHSLEKGHLLGKKKLFWLRFLKADSLNAEYFFDRKQASIPHVVHDRFVYLCIVHKFEPDQLPDFFLSTYYFRKHPAALLDFPSCWFWTLLSSFVALSGRLFLSLASNEGNIMFFCCGWRKKLITATWWPGRLLSTVCLCG